MSRHRVPKTDETIPALVPADTALGFFDARLANTEVAEKLRRHLQAGFRERLNKLSPHTRRSYDRGLQSFADYLIECGLVKSDPDPVADAGRLLVAAGRRNAGHLVQAYLQSMAEPSEETELPRYTTTTISSRLAAVRWAVKQLYSDGHVDWSTLDVKVPEPQKDERTGRLVAKTGRNMKGPPPEKVRAMVRIAREGDHLKINGKTRKALGARDLAVLLLIVNETLRTHEIKQINIGDVDVDARTLVVVRKKRSGPETIGLSPHTSDAIRAWKKHREHGEHEALFYGSERGGRALSGRRISDSGIASIVKRIGASAGCDTAPHKVRHSSITVGERLREQLRISQQDAMKRSGHRSLEAHQAYLDEDIREQRRLTDAVAAQFWGDNSANESVVDDPDSDELPFDP